MLLSPTDDRAQAQQQVLQQAAPMITPSLLLPDSPVLPQAPPVHSLPVQQASMPRVAQQAFDALTAGQVDLPTLEEDLPTLQPDTQDIESFERSAFGRHLAESERTPSDSADSSATSSGAASCATTVDQDHPPAPSFDPSAVEYLDGMLLSDIIAKSYKAVHKLSLRQQLYWREMNEG